MPIEYRWGVWSPPHGIWDLITEYVGFVSWLKYHSHTYWQVFQALNNSNISCPRLMDIYELLPDHYHNFIRKEHLLQFDLLPNGDFLADRGWDAFFSGLSIRLGDVVYQPG